MADIEVSVRVQASPERVWSLVGDPTRMGEWSPEWGYRTEPDPDGATCTVLESFTDRRGGLIKAIGPVGRGVSDVETHNRAGMQQTLAAIKAAAESAH